MKNFRRIAENVDVTPLAQELAANPGLWNQHVARLFPGGPHRETDDIWIRYKDQSENVRTGDWGNFNDPHIPIWYPAYADLPTCKKLIFDLAGWLESEMIGGVLIYRVPPGKQIYLHTDTGWHVEYFQKFNFSIQSQKGCAFYYPDHDEEMESVTGDLYFFRNNVRHGVRNTSSKDQLIMTVCLRTRLFEES